MGFIRLNRGHEISRYCEQRYESGKIVINEGWCGDEMKSTPMKIYPNDYNVVVISKPLQQICELPL